MTADPVTVLADALKMILRQCDCYTGPSARVVDPIRRVARQALLDISAEFRGNDLI